MRFNKLLGLSLAAALAIPGVGCAAPPQVDEQTQTEVTVAEEAAPAEETTPAEETVAGEVVKQAVGEVPVDDISVLWDESDVFTTSSLGPRTKITTYQVAGYDDVPFIRATDYLRFAISDKVERSVEDGVYKASLNGAEATIDPVADTITLDNYLRFLSQGQIDGAIIQEQEYNVITNSVKHTSTQTDPVPVTIDLKNYHMPVIAYEDDILMPFLALQNTFGGLTMQNYYSYNGKDYYRVVDFLDVSSGDEMFDVAETPYGKAFYSGPFSKKEQMSEAYAEYGYYATCLYFDLCYGHKEERNIDTFDEYFERIDVKKSLSSTDPAKVSAAEVLVFYYLFDSGHDASVPLKSVFKDSGYTVEESGEIIDDIKESEEGATYFDQGAATDDSQDIIDAITGALVERGFKIPELVPTLAWYTYFESAKPADYGEQRLDYVGDTAIIYFESFKDDPDRSPSFYLKPIEEADEETSNFAFFYNCFEDIKQHKLVKNVVLNIANNGGGSAAGLVSILGFLSDDGEVKFTDRDNLTGRYREEYYHVDTNLDGSADDADGFGGQYDFYIMTSGSSYSCGTALPYFAQRDGLATIIGSNPGGGDCVLGLYNDALGYYGAISGLLKIGTMDGSTFVSDETAVQVDFDMMPSILNINSVPWFDQEGIADAVHRYQNGETQMDYGFEGLTSLPSAIMELMEGLDEQ